MQPYTELNVKDSDIRDEVIKHLKAEPKNTYMYKPDFSMQPSAWKSWVTTHSFELYAFVERVYASLASTKKLQETKLEHPDGAVAKGNDTFYKFKIRGLIFEDINTLAREGVIMMVNKEMRHGPDFSDEVLKYVYDPEHFMVTSYGQRFLENHDPSVYSVSEYISILTNKKAPSDEIKAYIQEGLTCLHYSLQRPAILLLRAACEALIDEIISAIQAKLNAIGAATFKADEIRNFGPRAEATFKRLKTDNNLTPPSDPLNLRKRLEKAEKSITEIREYGNDVIHQSGQITIDFVRILYIGFAREIYTVLQDVVMQF